MGTKKKAVPPQKRDRKKGGGGRLERSAIVQVRFDQKLRYAVELASRRQRRTVSSFIEWAVQEAIQKVEIEKDSTTKVSDALKDVWDPDEADRFVKLASKYPDLLTHDEERLWKAICEYDWVWMLKSDRERDYSLEKNPSKVNLKVLRKVFNEFKLLIDGVAWKEEKDFISYISQMRQNLDPKEWENE